MLLLLTQIDGTTLIVYNKWGSLNNYLLIQGNVLITAYCWYFLMTIRRITSDHYRIGKRVVVTRWRILVLLKNLYWLRKGLWNHSLWRLLNLVTERRRNLRWSISNSLRIAYYLGAEGCCCRKDIHWYF